MKVLVLGSGVIGVDHRLLSRRGRPRGDGGRPAAGPGAGDQLRQCRRGVARLCLALGRARRAAEGDQVAADAHGPLVIRPMLDPAMWSWVLEDAAQLHLGPLRAQQGAHGADRRVQPRLPARAARRRPASPMTSAARARCSCSAPRSRSTGTAGDIEVLKQFGVPFEVLDPAGCIAAEPALARVRGKFIGGLQAARRRDRRLPDVHGAARRACARRAASASASAPRSNGIVADGDRIARRRRPAPAADRPTPMCVALGSYSPIMLAPLGIASRSIRSRAIRSPCRSRDAGGAPVSTVMDETYKVAITRLGDRIRVGGTAEISGYDLRAASRRAATR